jgi:hypothetical protein
LLSGIVSSDLILVTCRPCIVLSFWFSGPRNNGCFAGLFV